MVLPHAIDQGSEIITKRSAATASTTKATLATPTSGKKVRVSYITVTHNDATAIGFEVYFGTGANIGSNAGKEIVDFYLDLADNPSDSIVFPKGDGPIGAIDDVVSIRSTGTVGTVSVVVGYREE